MTEKFSLNVMKEGGRFFEELLFTSKPSYDLLVEEICKVLEIEKDQIEAIVKGKAAVREKNVDTLINGQELVVYLK